jgi:hypothetical protein
MMRFDTATAKIEGIIRDFEKKAEDLRTCADKLRKYQDDNKGEIARLTAENQVYQVSIDRAVKVCDKLMKLVS